MIFPKISGRLTVVILLGLVLLAGLGFWAVTSEDFADGQDKPLITRLGDGLRGRLSQFGIISSRRTKTSKKSSSKSNKKPAEATGPAVIRVTDSLGAPIPDAKILLRSAKKAVNQRTDKAGRVSLSLPLDSYHVVITHSKYSTEERTHQQIYGPRRGINLTVVMQTRVTVKGRVVDEEGKPVANVAVSGQRNFLQQIAETGGVFVDDAAYPTVLTDAKGTFKLPEVSLGSNTFTATLPGYATAQSKLRLKSGATPPELKFVLKRPSSISGRVVDEARQPVSGVKITALSYQPFGGSRTELPSGRFVVSTNSNGGFHLKKLFSDGYYHLKIEHPAYAAWEMPQVAAGTNGLQIVIQRGGEISGRVEYLDRTTTAAVVEVLATAVINGTTITQNTMSQGNGNFSLQRLPYGSYNLSVNYKGIINEPRGRVTSRKDRPTTGILVEVYEAADLAGRVVDSFTDEGIPDAQVHVRATYGATRQRVRQFNLKADSRGLFHFKNLPGGLHQVSASARDYLPIPGPDPEQSFPLSPGDRRANHTVYLNKGGTVRGQVVAPDGEGIGDAEVQLYVASGSFSTIKVKDLNQTTDGTGFFEFSGFPVGQSLSLYVSARKAGYAKKHSGIVELWPAQPEAATEVVLSPGGVISGRVVDSRNAPIYGVKVTYDSREFPGDPSPSEFYTFTDKDGNYLLEHCSPGRAVLVAEHKDYVRKIKSATVPEGRLLSRQNFQLETAYNISGMVADYKGRPLAGARVSAVPMPKATGSGRDQTDKTGSFEIKGLSRGRFRLEASVTQDTPEGKQSYTFLLPDVEAGSSGVPIDCDLEPSASGRILGEGGRGIETYKLTLRARSDTEPTQLFRFNLTRQVKNAGGRLSLSKVPRGIYYMKVEAAGYETWESNNVMIGPGNTTRMPPIRLRPASQIMGKVVSSKTGKPVQGARIRVLDDSRPDVLTVNRIDLQSYNRSDILEYLDAAFDEDYKYDPDPNSRLVARVRGNVVTTVQTDVYGAFSISDLADGTYTLEFEHPHYLPKRIRNTRVGRKQVQDLGEVALEPGGTIRGRVLDLDGNGLSNATIQIKGEQQGRNRARTDVGGNFVLRGIGSGEWPVIVQATVDGRKIYAWKNVSVRPDETSFVEFILEASADVTGQVLLADGALKSATASFYVLNEQGAVMDDFVYSTSVNASSGRYSLTRIPPGSYLVILTGKGPKGSIAGWQWTTITRGKNVLDFTSFNAGLAGTAVNSVSGQAAASATVMITLDVNGALLTSAAQNKLKLSTRTNARGKFSFTSLQPGGYRLWSGPDAQSLIAVEALHLGAGQNVSGYVLPMLGP